MIAADFDALFYNVEANRAAICLDLQRMIRICLKMFRLRRHDHEDAASDALLFCLGLLGYQARSPFWFFRKVIFNYLRRRCVTSPTYRG